MAQSIQPKRSLLPFGTAMTASTISSIGTYMTQFALVAWAWEATGSATAAGAVTVASFATAVITSTFSGALVDRWNRRLAVICSDAVGMLASVALLLLHMAGTIEVWHLAVFGGLLGLIDAVKSPAYLSSVSLMVPKEHTTRANAMFQLSNTLSMTLGPAVAGLMFTRIGFTGIILMDIATFAVVMVTVYFLNIPQPPSSGAKNSFWADVLEGFKYVWQRPSLLWMLVISAGVNVGYGTHQGIYRPMVLAMTGDNVEFLGRILAVYGVGAVLGGLTMVAWKGPRRRMPLHLAAWIMSTTCGFVLAPLVRIPTLWFFTGFGQGFFGQIAVAMGYAIWQAKVSQAMQGRVFSIMRFVLQLTIPISAFLGVTLSDKWAEPGLSAAGGAAAKTFGWLVGSGQGAGMSLVLFFAGCVAVALPIVSFFMPFARDIENRLPDQQQSA
ncbi:MAG TPA: MFS transporter [Symbiobacteriaceae bacterium]|nr:MFS transporter [Symbiobacteriaceae bacterium]